MRRGKVLNEDELGAIYSNYLYNIEFESQETSEIFSIKINNTFNYRISTSKIRDNFGNAYYIQLLANVDGEVSTIKNLFTTLILGNSTILILSIIISFILAKNTLKPLYESWNKQTEFVQNVAHELRTPLTIIQAKQQLLLEEPESKILDKSEDINISIKETRRLTKMIKELMLLSTTDMQKISLNKEETNIDEMIKEIAIPYIEYSKIENKTLNLELSCNKKVNIDRNKISQVIVIILDNAIKYTKPNDTITVKTKYKDGKCIIEISDTRNRNK